MIAAMAVVVTIAAARQKVLVPFANVPGALDDEAVRMLARELNEGNKTEVEIVVPLTLDEAIANLDFRPNDTGLEDVDALRKRVTAEWLFGREVDTEYQKPLASSIGEAFHANRIMYDSDLTLALMRAFQRWGHVDYVHLFVSDQMRNDKLVPKMLELAEEFPTINGTQVSATYLKGKYGDIAERIVLNSSEKNAKLLVPWYDSTDVTVVDRVERIFRAWNTDIDQARLDYYLPLAVGGESGAWETVADIPFDERNQKAVIDGLRRFDRTKRIGVDNWLDACLAWGDKSILPMVQDVHQGNWSFDKGKARKIMVKYPDASSVDVLVDALLNSWASEGDQIGKALFDLQKSGMEIDFVESVHKPVVLRYNDFAMFQKPAMKSLLERTSFDYNLLVDQCINDLRLSGKSNNAFETLSKMKVIEARRFEVAKAIQEVIQSGGIPGFHTEECFLHWATAENSHVYDILNARNFGGDNWKKALRIALTGEDYTAKVVVPVARAMSDFVKSEQVIDVLVEQGESIEDLMIFILQSDNPRELIGACRVLQVIGTEKCLQGLEKTLKAADRLYRSPELYDAAMLAGTIVTEKVESAKKRAAENGDIDEDDSENNDGG